MIHLTKREGMAEWKKWMIRAAALLLALVIGGLIMMIVGANPFKGYATILQGSFGSKAYIRAMIKVAVPLLGCALAIAPCFKMRYWNIGAEGQITAGALATAAVAFALQDKLPPIVLLPLMAIAAAVAGGIWSFIPGFFKAKFNTNETLFTLMMNYIIIGVVRYFEAGPWNASNSKIAQFDQAAWLPKVFGIHCGWIIALVMVVFVYIYMNYTKHGYEIAVIGDSENTARYAGMNVPRIIMRTTFLSGAMSGLVGYMLSAGASNTLTHGIAGGIGFTAITVCWLAQMNPFAMIGISILLAILEKGAETLQTRMNVPASISEILIGMILLAMLGCEFFINYEMHFERKAKEGGEVHA